VELDGVLHVAVPPATQQQQQQQHQQEHHCSAPDKTTQIDLSCHPSLTQCWNNTGLCHSRVRWLRRWCGVVCCNVLCCAVSCYAESSPVVAHAVMAAAVTCCRALQANSSSSSRSKSKGQQQSNSSTSKRCWAGINRHTMPATT
jgi:hypothetical protein